MGQPGHLARECPQPPTPKGVGKGKGPCYICDGPHLQRDCPKGKGKSTQKGNGTSGGYSGKGWQQQGNQTWSPQARRLCAIKCVEQKAAVGNTLLPRQAKSRAIADSEGFELVKANKSSKPRTASGVTTQISGPKFVRKYEKTMGIQCAIL